jgi:hypothetical protein
MNYNNIDILYSYLHYKYYKYITIFVDIKFKTVEVNNNKNIKNAKKNYNK